MKLKLNIPWDQVHRYRKSSSSLFELFVTILNHNIPLHQYNDNKKVLSRYPFCNIYHYPLDKYHWILEEYSIHVYLHKVEDNSRQPLWISFKLSRKHISLTINQLLCDRKTFL